ncbi:MAG: type II secretion system protein [Sulfurimonas sp.]|jgi:prepilin-type N-terminal cleavage/methylation domain-containing protein
MCKKTRRAFTLIEVMVAVMIISVVILALLQMFANNTHIFSQLTKQAKINQYASLFLANPDYGFETKSVSLNELVSDFKVNDALNSELKNSKVEIVYQKTEQIDMSEYDDKNREKEKLELNKEDKSVNSSMIFEIGKTVLKTDKSSIALFRLRLE